MSRSIQKRKNKSQGERHTKKNNGGNKELYQTTANQKIKQTRARCSEVKRIIRDKHGPYGKFEIDVTRNRMIT